MKIGAYTVERDYSHYTAYVAKTIFAVVGTATKGPIGVATVCTSAQDLVNKFGPVHPDHLGLYAGQYFLSQSSKLYFVRAATGSAAAASVILAGKGADNSDIEDALKLEFKEKGTFYNGCKLKVTVDTSNSKTYNLLVSTASGAELEKITATLEDLAKTVDGKPTFSSNYLKVVSVNTANTLNATDKDKDKVFAGGDDGTEDWDVVDEDGKPVMEKDASGKDVQKVETLCSAYITAAQTLAADTVDMNLCAIPGCSDAAAINAMLALAEAKGDCLFLVDPPAGLDRDAVIAWHNGESDYEHDKFDSSFGALYYDWVTIYDSVNSRNVNVPPSVVVAPTIAYSDRTSEVWFAPAGLTRGLVRGALNTVTPLNKSDIELLYSGNNCVNSIYSDPQVGLVIWGQKTLARTDTAMNRVNVRRLLNYLKRVVTAACNYLTFEPNDRITWNSFELKVRPILQSIQAKRGIYEFKIVRGETIVTESDIDNYRMPCMILIRPTKAAEEIPIYFTITNTGADFNEVLEANQLISEY